MEENIIIPVNTATANEPITFTVPGENTNVAAQNCWQQIYPSWPQPYYYGNTNFSSATYLYVTEEQLRTIVREEVSKAIEGLGSQIRRRAAVRKAE